MRIIESHEGILSLPREQLLINADIAWADPTCGIGLSTNNDPDAPYLVVTLTFYADDNDKQNYTVVFQEAPPRKPLEKIAVDGITVIDRASISDTEDYNMKELLDLVANRAYTPIAQVAITQTDHWLDIRLSIGEWEGHHQVTLAEFKEALGV